MIEPIPFVPDRFRSAAAHYLVGRPSYAPALIHRVAALCGLDGSGRLLDLGCGPGQLAAAFAPFATDVLAVDPEPEMLAEGERLGNGAAVTFRLGSSQDLDLSWGRFRAVTIGRAFHWMDRAETARRLDGMIEPGGALVLFRVDHLDVPDNAWRTAFQEALDNALGESGRSAWRGPGWVRHEAVLLDSPFPAMERVGVIERRRTPAASLIDRALSMSRTTRARLGAAADGLRDQVKALVAAASVDGMVTEVVESVALIARRT
jgi:SAM-dependent methyltransferase